jgi:2-desacetyl-2-hydroxyethyl bacteriochlorophyllide A dehydrogenase
MRAAVISGPGEVEVTTIDDPAPEAGEVVVAVAACGICGTDLHILDGHFAPSLPIVPGHEFAGEVVAVGKGVEQVAIGDRVAVDPSLYCGACQECRRGRGNLCERWGAIGVSTAGGAADFAVAPAGSCVQLPEHLDLRDAALIEPLSCAVRGFDVVDVRLGDRCLIYGAGTMGLINLTLALRSGATRVDVVDLSPSRLDGARNAGATSTAASADDLDPGRGWDLVIDCTGVVAAIEDGLGRVRRGGTFLQFGVANESAVASWSPFQIYNNEITIAGSMAVLHSFERAAELFSAGVLEPGSIISDRIPLEQYPDAIERFRSGLGTKTQILPGAATPLPGR